MTTYTADSIVFIDSRVPDLQDLLDGLQPGEQAFVLDAGSDGVQQIADILAANNFTGLSSISIVGHGQSGEMQLGSSSITDANLAAHSNALAEIGAALAPGGAIQLYGCDVAMGTAGQQFINDFSSFAGGAPVEASTRLVGSADLGGSWTLNASSGSTPAANNASAPFTQPALANFQGELSTTPDAQIWLVTGGGGKDNTVDHVNNNAGSNTASGLTTLYSQNPSAFENPKDVAIDPNDGKFFIVDTSDGSNRILEGSLFDAGPTPTLTTLYSDTLAFGSNISAIAVDSAHHQIYFTENVAASSSSLSQGQFERIDFTPTGTTGTNLVTLATVTDPSFNAGFEDFTLDLAHNTAYFTSSAAQFSTSSVTVTRNFLYQATGVTSTATSVTMNQLAINGGQNPFPQADGILESIGVDSGTETLYFTTDPTSTHSNGGVFSYAINGNAAGNIATVWLQPTPQAIISGNQTNAPFGNLSAIDLDATNGIYYVADGAAFSNSLNGGVDGHVYVGNLSGGAPTAFTQITVNNPGPTTVFANGMAIDNAPALAITASGSTWTEEGANVSLASSVIASDSDDPDLASATVKISGGFRSGDVLTDSTVGTSITSSYNAATGVLTLSGLDSVADYQSVLQSVQYHGGENPTDFSRTDTSRTLTWTVNDGLLTSAPQTSSVSVVFVNDPPALSGLTTASWTEEGSAATLSSGASVSDPDDLNLSGATVQITGGTFAGDADVLAANVAGTSITASYNAATETLTLSGTDTLAHYQSVLDSVTFSAGENPTNFGSDPTRSVTWVLTDPSGTANGGSDTSTTTSTINVLEVNDPPVLSNVASSAQFTENGSATTLSSAVTVTDPDDLNLSSATVKVTGGAFPGDGDVLAANVAGTNITASYNAATETLTLSGADTLANYQAVLDSVTFTSASDNPDDFGSNPTRTITWQAMDPSGTANGGSDTSTLSTTALTITAINDPPTLSGTAASVSFTENGAAVTLSPSASASDPDSLTLANATVQITGGFAGDGDVLTANVAGTSITASYNAATETLTLSGADTPADYQSVLDTVAFTTASDNPTDYGSNPTRTVTWALNDGAGSNNVSTVQTETINITAINDPPTLSNVAASAQYTEEGGAVTLANAITVTDPDNLNLANATVQITGGTFAGDADVLAATTTGTNITASYNSATETLTLTGNDTLANYQSVLDSVTFIAGENPNDFGSNPTRTVTWVANDGSDSFNLSNVATTTITVTNVNDAPTLSNIAASATFTQGGGALTLSGAASASDPDNLNLAGATVAISGGTFAGDGDVLAANVAGTAITASYNAVTETLALSGSDTLAHYSQVLESVTFNSTSGNPSDFGSNPTRTVTWVVNDGSGSFNLSTAQTETVNIVAVNQAPTLTGVAASAAYTEEGAATTLSGNVTVSDPDDTTLAGATVSITGGKFAGDADVLATSTSGTNIVASYNSTTETLTLSGTDTLAHYQSVLDQVTFSAGENPNDYGSNPTRTLTWVLNDGHASNNLSAAQTETLNITNVNDQPTLANVAATVGFLPHHTITISPSVAVSDPDNLTLANATVRITAGSFAGDGDVLAANVAGTSITASYNAATETLTLSGVDTVAHYQSVLDSVTFSSGNNPSNGNSNRTRTVTWVVNDGGGSNNLSTAATTTISIGGNLPRNDFNGDGNSDLLFQNNPDVLVEVLNGSSIASSGTITTPSGWTVEAMGDFNHDSKTDIVLQNSDGTPQIWLMNGTTRTSTVTLANPGSAWHIIAADDFNNDGNADILFQNNNGAVQIWEMNGTSVVTTATVSNPGSSWRVIGAGDFNGDGNADILFQNDDYTPMIWEMNGTSIVASATLPNPGKFWNEIGTGDFNGDGMSDILFQNKDGQPMIWEMNGTSIVTQATLSNPGKKWHAIGTEDFNGDGKADILFQNADGTPLIWQMNGTSVASSFTLANPGSQWVLQDDGPIPQSQMGSGANAGLNLTLPTPTGNAGGAGLGANLLWNGGAMHLSAPDAGGIIGVPPVSSGNNGSQQLNNQHPLFGT